MITTIGPSSPKSILGAGAYPALLTVPSEGRTLKFLYGGDSGLTASRFQPFYENGVQYVVPAGKKFVVIGMMVATGNGGQNGMQLASSTTIMGRNEAALTNGVYQGGAPSVYVMECGGAAAGVWVPIAIGYEFSANMYPCFQNHAAQKFNVQLVGYEADA